MQQHAQCLIPLVGYLWHISTCLIQLKLLPGKYWHISPLKTNRSNYIISLLNYRTWHRLCQPPSYDMTRPHGIGDANSPSGSASVPTFPTPETQYPSSSYLPTVSAPASGYQLVRRLTSVILINTYVWWAIYLPQWGLSTSEEIFVGSEEE